jgi:hypothetical protein
MSRRASERPWTRPPDRRCRPLGNGDVKSRAQALSLDAAIVGWSLSIHAIGADAAASIDTSVSHLRPRTCIVYVVTRIGPHVPKRTADTARVAAIADQRKEVIKNPTISMSFRREALGIWGAAVAVDLPAVDKRPQRCFSINEGVRR